MRRVGLALCAGLVLFAACGGDNNATGEADAGAETTAAATSNVTSTTAAATSAPTTAAAPTTPPTMQPPTTQPIVTAPPTSQAVVVTTAAPTTTKAKPTTTAPLVTFAEFSVVGPAACPAPDVSFDTDPQVIIKWKLAGVIPDDVYVAVENKDGAYQTGLPTQGELSLNYPCDDNQHTYYVVAVVGTQQFYKSKKV